MNWFVDNWKVSKEDTDPDVLEIDGERITMAERKSPQTETELTNDERRVQRDVNAHRIEESLSKRHFNTLVRFLKTANLETVKQVRTETYNNLKRLQVKRDLSKAPKGIPKGSDQIDVGTLIRFLRGIQLDDEKAIEQLVALDAVCCKREE